MDDWFEFLKQKAKSYTIAKTLVRSYQKILAVEKFSMIAAIFWHIEGYVEIFLEHGLSTQNLLRASTVGI